MNARSGAAPAVAPSQGRGSKLFSKAESNLFPQQLPTRATKKLSSHNPSKTVAGGVVAAQVEDDIDEVKANLLTKRRKAALLAYLDDFEAALEEIQMTDEELEYLRELLKSPHLEEEDAELVLSLFRDHPEEVQPHLAHFAISFPHLAKNIWSFCKHIEDKDFIGEMVSKAASYGGLQEYQLLWFAWVLQDYAMGTKYAPEIISRLYNHPNASIISKAKILEISDNRFGLAERVTRARAFMVDLVPKVRRTDAIQSFKSQETLFVVVEDAEGARGMGYSYTIGDGGPSVLALLQHTLLPRLMGQDADRIEAIWRDLLFHTHATAVGPIMSLALAAVDTALWDLRGHKTGLPLHVLADDRYYLTTKMFEVAHRHPPIRRLTSIAGEAMQRLADQLNQSIHLSIINSGCVLVIAQVDCPDNNITSVRLGANIPIYDTASGRVLAAWMEPPALEALLADAGDEPKDRRAAFVADLPEVRAAGYCESPSLTIQGVKNIAVPVFDFSGKVIASVTMPFIHRLSGTSIATAEECREQMIEVAAGISRRLGAGVR